MLTALWWRALRGLGVRAARCALAIAVSLLYAGTDEFHQTFVDGRNGTPGRRADRLVGIAIAAVALLRAAPHARPLAAERGVGERLERAR